MSDQYSALHREFVDETQPLIDRVCAAFLELERRWKLTEAGEDLLPQIKSDLHTIKGNAAMMGLAPLQSLAHALEDAIALVGGQAETRCGEMAELLIEGGDRLSEMMQSCAAQGPGAQLDAAEVTAYVAYLRQRLAQLQERREGIERRSGEDWRSGKDRRQSQERRKEPPPRRSAEEPIFSQINDTIRVDFKRLDELLETVGEGVIIHSVLQELQRRLLSFREAGSVASDLDKALLSLDKIFKRLQQSLMETRLLPVSTVFNRFKRLVRDLSVELSKPVQFVIEGEETRIDKRILDRLGEPLLHLIRNAMAHGIEKPEERRRLGKKEEGILCLSAQHFSNQVIIMVSDDGRGLDAQQIRQRAESLGIDISTMSDDEVQRLIFTSGFSTAGDVSELSGRGVGLDVVVSSIHELGGNIELRSEPGQGTRFDLVLPLTLTVVKSLLVEIDGEIYAIPLGQIVESARLDGTALHEINHKGVIHWRNELIHVTDGGTLVGSKRCGERHFFVVIISGSRKRGVMVDRLLGHQDIVVKGLDEAMGKLPAVSGATILGDGRVVFIVDVANIVEQKSRLGSGAAAAQISL